MKRKNKNNLQKQRKETRKYKGGGYVIEEHPNSFTTMLEMNGKGFYEEFGKPFLKRKGNKI